MYCKYCGSDIKPKAKFCPNCGGPNVAAQQSGQEANQDWQQAYHYQPENYEPETYDAGQTGAPSGQDTAGQAQYQHQPQYQQYQQSQNTYQTTCQNNAPVYYVSAPGQGAYGGYGTTRVDFGEAIRRVFNHFADFNGRASLSEFWWGTLFLFIVSWAGAFIPLVNLVLWIPIMIAQLALGVRRLHDTGREGAYILMGLIPCAGFIILLVFYCSDSVGDNQWGPSYRTE